MRERSTNFIGQMGEPPRHVSDDEAEQLDQRRKYIKIFESLRLNDESAGIPEWQQKLYRASMTEGMTAEEWADQQIERDRQDAAKREQRAREMKESTD